MTTSRRRQIALASLLLLSPAAAAASNRKKVAFHRSVVRPAMSLKQNMKDSETMTNLRNNIRRLIVPSKTSPFSQLDNGTIKINTSKNVWNLAQRYSPTFLPFYGEHDLLVHIAGMYDGLGFRVRVNVTLTLTLKNPKGPLPYTTEHPRYSKPHETHTTHGGLIHSVSTHTFV